MPNSQPECHYTNQHATRMPFNYGPSFSGACLGPSSVCKFFHRSHIHNSLLELEADYWAFVCSFSDDPLDFWELLRVLCTMSKQAWEQYGC